MKTRSYLYIVMLLTVCSLAAGCDWVNRQAGGGSKQMAMAEPEGPMPGKGLALRAMAAPPPMMAAPAPMAESRKVMRSASLTVEVRDIEDADRDARRMAEGMGGHVAGSSAYEDNAGVRSLRLTIKVPAEKIEEALAALKGLGRVREEDTSSADVTEQYVDIEARLANAQRLEKRLSALVDAPGARLKDLMETERELGRVRTEIEGLQTRKRFMDGRIELATIEATLIEPRGFGRGIFQPLSGILQRALAAFTSSLAALVIVTSAIVPWIAIIILAGWVVIRMLRIYLRHKRQKKQNP
ncbi:MAG: DUF4349 domain-containing protein [Proteobacteria bacterium]|nr:DUF4349 domain-containing protein [Pseudomonadota bacterium]